MEEGGKDTSGNSRRMEWGEVRTGKKRRAYKCRREKKEREEGNKEQMNRRGHSGQEW